MPATANRKVTVHLSADQRAELVARRRRQTIPAATARRARVLRLADEGHPDGQRPDRDIAAMVGVSDRQVARIRQRFVHHGLSPAVDRKAGRPAATPPQLDGAAEARLVTLCGSDPPAGRERWTRDLLVDELCRLQVVASVCRETVRTCPEKAGRRLGGRSGSASPRRTGRGSSPRWNRCSTRTTARTTRSTH